MRFPDKKCLVLLCHANAVCSCHCTSSASLICRLPVQSSSWEPKKRTVHVSRSYKCRPVHLPQLVFQSMHDHARCQLSVPLSMANSTFYDLQQACSKKQLARFTSLCVWHSLCAMPLSSAELEKILNRKSSSKHPAGNRMPVARKRPAADVVVLSDSEPHDDAASSLS